MTIDSTALVVIAIATATMALAQVGVAIYTARVARHAARTLDALRRDIDPILANARQASEDATRLTALALVQVERVDAFVATTTERVGETLDVVQGAVQDSVRSGAAVLAGLRAALAFFSSRQARRADSTEEDDDESLFIG